MMRDMRRQITEVLLSSGAARKPALRRSDAPDALLATDLPLIVSPEAALAAIRRLTELGYRTWPAENGWLLMDAPLPVPEAEIPENLQGESGCCISLLARHPHGGDAGRLIRAAVKAEEAGLRYFDRFCAELHGELAARLRRHEPLPGALLPYLCRAYHTFDIGRTTR